MGAAPPCMRKGHTMSDISIRSIPYVWEEARPHEWEEERVMGMLARRGLAGSDLQAMLGLTVEAPAEPVVAVVPVARRLSRCSAGSTG